MEDDIGLADWEFKPQQIGCGVQGSCHGGVDILFRAKSRGSKWSVEQDSTKVSPYVESKTRLEFPHWPTRYPFASRLVAPRQPRWHP